MADVFEIRPIAHIKNKFTSKFGIPRQSCMLDKARSQIIFEPQFRNEQALRGIEEYSHLWLIWQFSESLRDEYKPMVRPPRLGGNARVGVYATRSPFRPNSLGLSSVKLIAVKQTCEYGKVLEVAGADLMNGTPIFDIKPYIKYTDSHPDARCSFSDRYSGYFLRVELPDALAAGLSAEDIEEITGIIKSDPRPGYQHDPYREYTFDYGRLSVSFKVSPDGAAAVTKIVQN